ncbi:MAG: hypothetical protein KAS40_19025, partial [Desulfobacterales bacterium]|nr:hypothetical protein [Desulfobacterales bacterium]
FVLLLHFESGWPVRRSMLSAGRGLLLLIADVTDVPKSHPLSNNSNPVGTRYSRVELIDRFS